MGKRASFLVLAAATLAFAVALPSGKAASGDRGRACAKQETVATGSPRILRPLAKVSAEIAWEIKVVKKYGLLWYSWWAAKNNRFNCTTRNRQTVCVARGTPCRLL